MAYKDILVHIDSSKQCATRLSVAINLARECQAHLTGLYVITHQHYAPHSESMQRRVAEAAELFRQQTAQAEVSAEWLSADWGTVGVGMVEVLNHYAHAKDLTIVGQSNPADHEGEVPSDLPERVVAGSGRPVLVVPYAGSFGSVGQRVIVAWKSGRESARAVNDAMPFLLTADQVSVVTVNPAGDLPPAEKIPEVDICANLERHAIRASLETLLTGKIPVARLLMEYAWENGCDLLVMGLPRASHNLGPVARQILDQMTIPVLMVY